MTCPICGEELHNTYYCANCDNEIEDLIPQGQPSISEADTPMLALVVN